MFTVVVINGRNNKDTQHTAETFFKLHKPHIHYTSPGRNLHACISAHPNKTTVLDVDECCGSDSLWICRSSEVGVNAVLSEKARET